VPPVTGAKALAFSIERAQM